MRMGELGSGEDAPALRFTGWHLGLYEPSQCLSLTPQPGGQYDGSEGRESKVRNRNCN